MRAFIKFNKGMMKMPLPWQLWLVLLLTVNLFVPFFYIDRVEAQVVLAVLVASFVLSTILTARVGFTRLLGWSTSPTCRRRLARSTCLRSTPSTVIEPELGS